MQQDFGELIEPAPVRFSFGAPGWYVLAALVLLLLMLLAMVIVRYLKRNHYRKTALQWLAAEEQRGPQPDALVYAANMLLKRIAMRNYGRERVAAVQGEEWIKLLNTTCRKPCFDAADSALLQHDLYAAGTLPLSRAVEFVLKSKRWIKTHRHAF
ncbi:DUF4381 domain-containing protein [Deminuibacter soli]|uniref:DUF4381 domain-containing protein n=1 Tax=Deminuibacter soli TaxID=2291815 RepID=A0A3E1NHI3_9BACT|nr:DUF4381 domain-containing protein [Deminuibacter soli]RFM27314.1 DUF4381 domain-containing protein [Deminuibacter soli]